MALHELFIDGKSTADFGAYVCGGGTWKTPKRKGSVVNVAGRNGSLWIDDGAWDNVTIRYDVMFNNNSAEVLDSFTTWLASLSMGEHRIEDTLHPRYYRMGRANCSISPRVVEKWNSSKFSFDVICRPEKFVKEADEYIVFAPLQHAYVATEDYTSYWFTKDSSEPHAQDIMVTPLMYYVHKYAAPVVDIYIDNIKPDDNVECYISDIYMGEGWSAQGEMSRFTSEGALRVYGPPNDIIESDDHSMHIRHYFGHAEYSYMMYRLGVIAESDVSVKIEQGGDRVFCTSDKIRSTQSVTWLERTIHQTYTPFESSPLIRVRGWSFNIVIDGIRIVADDYRPTREIVQGTDAWKMARPVDFYIDCASKELYYVDWDGRAFVTYDYSEHIAMEDAEDGSKSYKFPTLKNGSEIDVFMQQYLDITDYLFCSVAIKPRWYMI